MEASKIILSIETSQKKGSLCLLHGTAEIGRWEGNEVISRSEDLVSGIGELLAVNDLSVRDIGAVVVSEGPGSFTGLRVGIAVGKGLATALGCPLVGVSMLETFVYWALKEKGIKNRYIGGAIGAGRDNIYRQLYEISEGTIKPVSEVKIISIDNFAVEAHLNIKDTAIIVEAAIFDKLETLFDTSNPAPEIICMSGNPAKYTGLYALSKNFDFGLMQNEVVPIYVREV